MENFTIDYFIQKFKAIPENQIGKGSLKDHCALYHCGVTPPSVHSAYQVTEEARSLAKILSQTTGIPFLSYVSDINDSDTDSAKNNILNALYKAKADSQSNKSI